MAGFNVPKEVERQLLLSGVYSVGVGGAVARSKKPKDQTNYTNVPKNGDSDMPKNSVGSYDKTAQWDGYMASSLQGLPVACYIKFIGGTYIDLEGNTLTVSDIIFETVLISLTRKRTIKKTDISGRDSSVKEFIGLGDWDISIEAIITSDAPVNSSVEKKNSMDSYPYDNMKELDTLLNAPVAIEVECRYLNQRGINWIVIEDGVQINQIQGEYSMQRITIPACSEKPLIIKKAN